VVLVFGGQNGKSIHLGHSWLETFPMFRTYMDQCDRELRMLGYPSLYPAIFSNQDLPTAVLLQCGMFAVQYACASCWIDAGLNVESIVGHSLGELVALVVSKALSLGDGMRLVASRAHLIDTKWGEDQGSMLAIHASPPDVIRLIKRVESISNTAKLEIACYNSPLSVVVAGKSESIELAEHTLREDASFAGIEWQHVSTTHAFHSILTEPILEEMDNVAGELNWHEPALSLELCSSTPLNIKDWTAAKHLREPVCFF
jgi:acyl transferase domain-containing protein